MTRDALTRLIVPAVLLAMLCAAAPGVRAGDEDACKIDAEAIVKDFGDLLAAPVHWDTEQWLAAAATGAATGALVAWGDEGIRRAASENPNGFPYMVAHKLAILGRWYGKNDINPVIAMGVVAGGMWIAGEARDDPALVRTAAIAVESWAFTGILTGVIKMVAGRSRPFTGDGAHRWSFVGFHPRERRSFPSGHAASAFSLASTVSRRHDDWWVQVPAYTLATGAALARVDTDMHWASDVLFGAVLGAAVSAFLVERHTCDDDDAGSSGTPAYLSFSVAF
jgi:membrane-associated phospholipid phosphatase